jgi:hypothetical protein
VPSFFKKGLRAFVSQPGFSVIFEPKHELRKLWDCHQTRVLQANEKTGMGEKRNVFLK